MNDAPFLVGLSGKENNPRPILADKKFEVDLSVSGNIFHIDGGNYHYLSLFTTKLIMEDFALVLFDNHTDTQLPSFGGILSCGSWAREAFITNPHLKK